MRTVILSGGSGKRLWPLSNGERAKQFLRLIDDGGKNVSMLEYVYGRLKKSSPGTEITVSCSLGQAYAVNRMTNGGASICPEPERRDTFAAVLLSALFLKDIKGASPDETVVIFPVDGFADESFFELAAGAENALRQSGADILLIGVEPTYPSEKYGYILPESAENPSRVKRFTEKPDETEAEKLIESGALWNAGVFCFRLGYIAERCRALIGTDDYEKMLFDYSSVKRASFDREITEKADNVCVLRYGGEWRDIGTWNTFSEATAKNIYGKATADEYCENTSIINETEIPLLVMGIKNAVVTVTESGILVADKGRSSHIGEYLE